MAKSRYVAVIAVVAALALLALGPLSSVPASAQELNRYTVHAVVRIPEEVPGPGDALAEPQYTLRHVVEAGLFPSQAYPLLEDWLEYGATYDRSRYEVVRGWITKPDGTPALGGESSAPSLVPLPFVVCVELLRGGKLLDGFYAEQLEAEARATQIGTAGWDNRSPAPPRRFQFVPTSSLRDAWVEDFVEGTQPCVSAGAGIALTPSASPTSPGRQ